MNDQQKKSMQAGRERARLLADREAAKRVNAFMRWVKSGEGFKTMPEKPSDADFRAARRVASR